MRMICTAGLGRRSHWNLELQDAGFPFQNSNRCNVGGTCGSATMPKTHRAAASVTPRTHALLSPLHTSRGLRIANPVVGIFVVFVLDEQLLINPALRCMSDCPNLQFKPLNDPN